MAMTLTSSTRTIVLPEYAQEGLKPLMVQSIAKNYSLGGQLTVDKLSIRGGYKITFETLTRAEWQGIVNIFKDQFTNNEMLVLNDPDLSESNSQYFLNIPEEQDLRWNKQATQGMQIVLEPRYAIS